MKINYKNIYRFLVAALIVFTIPLSMMDNVLSTYTSFNIPKVNSISALLFFIMLPFFFVYQRFSKYRFSNKSFFLVFSIVILYFVEIIVVIYHYDTVGYSSGQIKSAIEYHAPIFLLQIMYIVIGFSFCHEFYGFVKKMVFVFFIFYLLILFLYAVDFSILKLFLVEEKINYLFLGDMTAMMFMVFFSFSENKKPLIFSLGLVVLFLITSRSSFYIYIISFCFYGLHCYWLGSRNKRLVMFSLIFIATSLFLLVGADSVLKHLDMDNYRVFRVFSDSDTSKMGRDIINHSGMQSIISNWFIGDFGGQVDMNLDGRGARWGQYIHNFFSIWRQFGFVAFVIYSSMLGFLSFFTARVIMSRKSSQQTDLYILFAIFSIISVLMARSYIFTSIYLFMGYFIAYNLKKVSD
ncbi:hypothetical protein [Vibrio tritonius]|uniref:hypothetical protein n=1 Tax=Vibrio tritonius TaxID=1435069 RepID=UPI000A500580|nr:hypothetical protein [Vibrio tritonius]